MGMENTEMCALKKSKARLDQNRERKHTQPVLKWYLLVNH